MRAPLPLSTDWRRHSQLLLATGALLLASCGPLPQDGDTGDPGSPAPAANTSAPPDAIIDAAAESAGASASPTTQAAGALNPVAPAERGTFDPREGVVLPHLDI